MLKDELAIGAGAVVVILVVGYFVAKKAGLTAPGALDITSDQNLAYKGANAITRELTGDPNATVGNTVWRWLNPEAAAIEARITAPSWTGAAWTPAAIIGGPGW